MDIWNSYKHTVSDGTELMLREARIEDAKADIFFCHGFKEYSGRYHAEAEFFNKAGYNFLCYDLRSHGESGGHPRSWINDFSDYTSDYLELIEYFRLGHERPYYTFAHSMGGLVTINALLEKDSLPIKPKAVLLSAPLLAPNADMAPLLQKLSSFVSMILPRLKTIKLDIEEISRDPEERKKYAEDPLIDTSGVYARTAYSLLRQMKATHARFKHFDYDFIVQHSRDDKLSEFGGSQKLYDNSSSQDKTLIELKEFRHEITREYGHEEIMQRFLDWLEAHS